MRRSVTSPDIPGGLPIVSTGVTDAGSNPVPLEIGPSITSAPPPQFRPNPFVVGVAAARAQAARARKHLANAINNPTPADKQNPQDKRQNDNTPPTPPGQPQVGNCQGPMTIVESISIGLVGNEFVFGADDADDGSEVTA